MSPSQKFTTRALGLMFLVTIAACGDDEVDTGPPITLVEEENNATTPDNSSANATANNVNNTTTPANSTANMASNNTSNNTTNMAPNASTPNASTPNNTTPRVDETGLVLLDLEEVPVTSGFTESLTFMVPENTQSVTVTITGKGGITYGLAGWINGDGSNLVPEGWHRTSQVGPTLCLTCVNRVSSSEAAFGGIAPNNAGSAVEPGMHQIKAMAFRQSFVDVNFICSTSVDVHVTAKVAEAPPTEGILDLNFYFSGAGELTAESAQTDADFQQTLEDLRALYAPVGITIGELTYTDIDAVYQVIEGVVLPDSELQEMFALSGDNPARGLNVFIVDELLAVGQGGGIGTILGISGGIPGPAFPGTKRSGVAVALARTPEANTALYKVLGHEIGHHLGLFHSTEANQGFGPSIHDPIADTPEDDNTNLMFHFGDGSTLTAEQSQVMRLNPWVRQEGGEQ